MSTIQQYIKKFNIKKQNLNYESKIENLKKESPFFQSKNKATKCSKTHNKLNISKTKTPITHQNEIKNNSKTSFSNLSKDFSTQNIHSQQQSYNLNIKNNQFSQRAPINNINNNESPLRRTPLNQTERGASKNKKMIQLIKNKNHYYNTPFKEKRTATPVIRPNKFLSKFPHNPKNSLSPYSQGIPKSNKNGKKCKTPVYNSRKQLMNSFELNRTYGEVLNISNSKENPQKTYQKVNQKDHNTIKVKNSYQNNSDITSSTVKSVSKQKSDSKNDLSPILNDTKGSKKENANQPENSNKKSNNDYNISPLGINEGDDKKKNIKKRQLSIQNDFETTYFTQNKNSKNGNVKNNNINNNANNDLNNLGNKSALNNMNNNNNNNTSNLNISKFDKIDNQNISSTSKIETPKINIVQKKIKNKSCFTRVGFDGQHDKEFNQDSYQIFENFANNSAFKYITVCDGHGDYGHLVSNYIQNNLPSKLSSELRQIDILNDTSNLNQIVQNTFLEVNKNLINENIDTSFSGTTCCSVIFTPSKLICANLGDSRAVLGRFINGHWESFDLTRDHKPSDDDEAERIIENGGIIVPLCENGQFYGPKRIWVELNEYPGLAMSRSFGDEIAETVGKICVPEMSEYNLRECDKFFIVASDGVWEFFNSYDVITSIGKFYADRNIKDCCKYIYEVSKEKWLKEEETIDDITMVIIFFE